MKRRKPLKRGKGGLRRAEFQRTQPDQSSEAAEKQSKPLARGTGLSRRKAPLRSRRPKRPPEGPLTPEAWMEEVYRLDGGRSVLSGAEIRNPGPANFHHALSKQQLRRRGFYGYVNDPRLGITLTMDEHASHETAARRVPLEALPSRVHEVAEELGPWALGHLRRYHPPRQEGVPDG